ncbi:Pyridoxal phosphate-dependent transferase, subdomain 2,Aminotransferase class-III,Pyridoxal phosphate- [Cinara cedri]|uniref:Pyridoxal phosphate-dependent transferase, subdomain 2,Aminotransferase class-III,Pyridoxal phosphate n=1 Tax=Cinara cedri TaxID=506608 RepID=A0A5E4N391_9HEMI|nr:Pyridoxal phosphate-dependent transferase, subdomain 2,Aminotransferase class-III,Pyridoxal phosphate- [Cinara cedri]
MTASAEIEKLTLTETIDLRNKYVSKSCELFYKKNPLKIVRGRGQYLYDHEGREYLDCINNVSHVGHCHPDVVNAGVEQMHQLNTNSRFLHDNLVVCAEKIVSKMPESLSVCFFVNSGSEANDLALRLARQHTGNTDIVTLDHAYHGHLISLIDISPYKFNLPGAPKKPDHVHVAPVPDVYRGKLRTDDYPEEDMGKLYALEVKRIIDENVIGQRGQKVCAYIAESLQSCGGQIILPHNYLRDVYKYVREAGGLCIADEVQVGFGRSGTHYWAFELDGSDIVPDIVTIGKPMGNGHPIAAVITTEAVARSFEATGIQYFNTYGGNPVSCAIANAVIDVLDKEKMMDNAKNVGEYLLSELKNMQNKFPDVIGDVRGVGFFVGIELIKNPKSKTPATEETREVVNRMKDEEGILVSCDGPDVNVIKLKPPMVFDKGNADKLLKALKKMISDIRTQRYQLL